MSKQKLYALSDLYSKQRCFSNLTIFVSTVTLSVETRPGSKGAK